MQKGKLKRSVFFFAFFIENLNGSGVYSKLFFYLYDISVLLYKLSLNIFDLKKVFKGLILKKQCFFEYC